MYKNFFRFLAAGMMLLGTVCANAQVLDEGTFIPKDPRFTAPMRASTTTDVTHEYAWYEAKTYTWTDANNQTHTAKLTDEVTNPYQMYDMLRWVYCNPEIPGSLYSEYTRDDTYYGRQRAQYNSETGWNINNNDVTAPTEAGHTLFLVKLKNYSGDPTLRTTTKQQLINYFSTYVESIHLITDGLRAGEGNNVGTMFNISGEFNRFFIIGKGKSYYCEPSTSGPPYAPFYNMFEEYSPTTNDEGATITDFYEKMTQGETYPVIHDCTSVIYFKHFFSMSGNAGTEEKSLTGMVFFIPDNRNVYNARNYSTTYQPTVGMYVIQLDANAAPAAEPATYNVTLDWTSSLDEITGANVPQTYTVYIVKTDEYGNQSYELLTTTTETTYTYQVPQEEHSYTISYIVYGQTSESNAFSTWSNIDDVVIPGTNDFLRLVLNHFESDYSSSVELNYYRNFLNVENEDALNALTPARILAGEDSFMLYRFDMSNPDVMIPAAELKFNVNNNNVTYTITYDNQEPLAGYNINVKTNGNLGNYAANAAVDLSDIMFVDQFAASTADNTHPNRYGYKLIELVSENAQSTNTVEVPVQKTASTIDGFYTLDEIMSDVDRHLTTNIKNANVEMNLINNPNIYYYTLERGNNVNPNEPISKLQRRQDGTFMEMDNTLGLAGNVYEEGAYNLFDNDVLTGNYGDFVTYVPVIWTFGSDRVKQDGENSYGSPIWKTGVGQIAAADAKATYTAGEYVTWKDENGQMCCFINPVINVTSQLPDYASVDYDVFMYRVWRLCDGIRFSFYNPITGLRGNDINAVRVPDKLIVEEMTDATNVKFGDEIYDNPINDHNDFGGLAYGALVNSTTKFIVRMYYVKKDGGRDDAPMYYVVEKTINDWSDYHVGVNELNVNNETTTTYYNALGVASDKPFKGVNIVVTRHSDGTTTTSKVVK